MPVIGSTKQNKTILIGVAGGSGSGKTFFARALQKELGEDRCALVFQDNFYKDQSSRFDFDGGSVNFDHPDAIDFALLAETLNCLKRNEKTQIPIYDFVTHSRQKKTLAQEPRSVVLVDGILIFHSEEVRALFDQLIFFETPEELRFKRRLERDVQERGRSPEGVKNQFLKQVKPMHDQFVEPSKRFAHRIVKDEGDCQDFLAECAKKLLDAIG